MTELEYDRQIAQQELKNMSVNPVVFEVFPALSSSPGKACREEVGSCDIFLMILWKVYSPAVWEEYDEALRQNMPILVLVKLLVAKEEHEPALRDQLVAFSSDSPAHSSARLTYKTYRKIDELREAVRGSVAAEIARIYEDPVYTAARNKMYELGTSIIRDAERRLYLYQRTPSLILSSRDYLAEDSTKYGYEREFENTLWAWVNMHERVDREFLYLFSTEATRREIADVPPDSKEAYVAGVRERVEELMSIEATSGHRFRIAMVDVPICGPLIVGDNRYAIWVIGSDQAVSISQYNKKICDILVMTLNSHGQKHVNVEEILDRLGI